MISYNAIRKNKTLPQVLAVSDEEAALAVKEKDEVEKP